MLTNTNGKAIWMESTHPATEIHRNKCAHKSTCSNSLLFFCLLYLSRSGPKIPKQTACYNPHISQHAIQETSAQIVPCTLNSLSFYILLGDGQTSKEPQFHTKKPQISPQPLHLYHSTRSTSSEDSNGLAKRSWLSEW